MEQDKKRELQEKITKFQPIARNGGKKTNLPRTLDYWLLTADPTVLFNIIIVIFIYIPQNRWQQKFWL